MFFSGGKHPRSFSIAKAADRQLRADISPFEEACSAVRNQVEAALGCCNRYKSLHEQGRTVVLVKCARRLGTGRGEMAYEVARVHGMILSNIQDGEKDVTDIWPTLNSVPRMPRMASDLSFFQDFPTERNQLSECSHSSLESSTETESDDDNDFIAGLAEQIAHSMLDDDEPGSNLQDAISRSVDITTNPMLYGGLLNAPSQKVSGSSQLSWSPNSSSVSWSDSVSSSKQSSQVSSPPSTPSTSENDAWDLLNAAAGEVVRLKMTEESRPVPIGRHPKPTVEIGHASAKQSSRPCARPSAAYAASNSRVPNILPMASPPICNGSSPRMGGTLFNSKDRFSAPGTGQKTWTRPRYNQQKLANPSPFPHRLSRNDGGSWNQRPLRSGAHGKSNANNKSSRQNLGYGHHSRISGRAAPCIRGAQRSGAPVVNGGSGMRAVFLGGGGSGRESGGTGVFLPRSLGGGNEQRRKPACSTVLLPSRIVQVLNLNVEDMRSHPTLPASAVHNRSDFHGALRNPSHMYMMDLAAGHSRFGSENVGPFARKAHPHIRRVEPQELSLPTEWTY